jgi:hypothetical protein
MEPSISSAGPFDELQVVDHSSRIELKPRAYQLTLDFTILNPVVKCLPMATKNPQNLFERHQTITCPKVRDDGRVAGLPHGYHCPQRLCVRVVRGYRLVDRGNLLASVCQAHLGKITAWMASMIACFRRIPSRLTYINLEVWSREEKSW